MTPSSAIRLLARSLWMLPLCASAQSSFIHRYTQRVAATQLEQPHWATPLITVNARLEQGFRADFVRQTAADGTTTWNLGNTKGLQLVPLRRVELRFSPPPFFTRTSPSPAPATTSTPLQDGFGDVGFRLKYRLYGSSEEHHNAIVTAVLNASLPTGKNGNGSCCAIITPTLEFGKGFSRLALTTSLGGTLPASNTIRLGRTVVWNNAIQLHVTRLLWIESEFNTTWFHGGKNDGHQQTFITPGIIVSRIPLSHPPGGRPAPFLITFGAGMQIALTHFKTYDHSPILTARLRF